MSLLGKKILAASNRLLLQKTQFKYYLRSICSSSSDESNNHLLSRLLQLPNSKIKWTLDSHFSSNNPHFSLDFLVFALSSDKARLVLEWRLDRMLQENERDQVHYSNLISLCAKIRNVSLAMRVFTSMEANGIQPNTSVFNSLICACLSSSNDVLTALNLFEIMESSQLYKPDSQTYDTFVLGFSGLRDVDKMVAWFAAKKAAGYSANLQNYECLISTCARIKDFDRAVGFYDEMMSVGVMPSVVILEWILEGLCKCRNCERVSEFLRFLLECRFEFTVNMCEQIVGLYSEPGKVDELEKLVEALTDLNQVGDALQQLHCGIIRYYSKMDRLDDVEYCVGKMMSRGMLFKSSDDLGKVISSYFRNEAYDRLDVFLEHVKGYQKLTRCTYDLLVAGYRRAGMAEKLKMVIEDMKLTGNL